MITRRNFMKLAALCCLSGYGLCRSNWFSYVEALPAINILESNHILVVIFQRGAMDGLMAVTPYIDPMLSQLRPSLLISAVQKGNTDPNKLIDLDGRFALHPAFGELEPLFHSGRLAVVHGVGLSISNRSHFDAQDYIETGVLSQKGFPSGWLNRSAGLLPRSGALQAISLTPTLPRSLSGEIPALAMANLSDLGIKLPTNSNNLKEIALKDIRDLYAKSNNKTLRIAAQDGLAASQILASGKLNETLLRDDLPYPKSSLGSSLQQIAKIIKSNMGLRIACTESSGWDTHVGQGTTNGAFARSAKDLSQALGAFWRDITDYQSKVLVLTVTEFGRTVRENGSKGTDHGRGSCMFILGGSVKGGQVYGTLPELHAENLVDQRDLPVTTDFRSVFAEVLRGHLGIQQMQKIFPDNPPLGSIKLF
ncbi:DUF1501 domain-containing protein [Pelosinus sp. sgz500959]|uniref:DUF1501 domain-containing protein n=1 Tax=Pelosinus sp. sgz500959 TaxID=3242472 RepID=UPI003671624D